MAIPSVTFGHRLPVAISGFGAVAPPRIEALSIVEELAVGPRPVVGTCLFVEDIDERTVEHISALLEILLLRIALRIGPDAHHQTSMQLVHGVGQSLRIGIIAGIHLHHAPALGPVVPVLHNHIDGNPATAELTHRLDDLGTAVVTLLRLDVAKQIARHHRRLSGERTHTVHDTIHRSSLHEIIIQSLGSLQFDESLAVAVVKSHTATRIEKQAVARRGGDYGNHGLQIVLAEPKFLSLEVEQVLHVGAPSVERLIGRECETHLPAPRGAHRVALQHVHHHLLAIGGPFDSA